MKTYVLTLAYSNPDVWRAGMKSLDNTVMMTGVRHLILNNHYPLRQAEMIAELDARSKLPDVAVFDVGRNLGLHEGLNYLMDQIELDDDDVVVGFDADEDPQQVGWLDAMLRVFAGDPKCGWLSLMSPPAKAYMKDHGFARLTVHGEEVHIPGYSLINTVCAWRGAAIKAMGRFTEPHLYYGGFEGHMMPRCMDAGFWIGWMADYTVKPHHGLADPEYSNYKAHHVGFRHPEFPGSFEDWLRMKA